eukprot:12878377-Alexandrium_andersonii.AAC.1
MDFLMVPQRYRASSHAAVCDELVRGRITCRWLAYWEESHSWSSTREDQENASEGLEAVQYGKVLDS